jgi:hypothetical protein
LASVIDMAHEAFGMRVFVGACANTVGNERAAAFGFQDRPYFVTERRLNPGDPTEVEELFGRRREALSPLARADGCWVIDSDPGGYGGSPPEEFVALLRRYRNLLDELRPGIELVYWVWWGWPARRHLAEKKEVWRTTLSGLKEANPEPWSLHVCNPDHAAVAGELGLLDRAYSFRYGAIENEPSLPWTRHDPGGLYAALRGIPGPKGSLGNAQTHPVQLPHIYYFSHFARGGTPNDADLDGFAERLLPGRGRAVAAAWRAFGETSAEQIDGAVAAMEEVRPGPAGDLQGLLFGSGDRFVGDLRAQHRLRRAEKVLEDAAGPAGIRAALRALLEPLATWVSRHGFDDFCWAPILHRIRRACEAVGEDEVIELFRLGIREDRRHGFLSRLLDAMKRI